MTSEIKERHHADFQEIYGLDNAVLQEKGARFDALVAEFRRRFPGRQAHLFSTPGRTEIAGNHTDHNRGRVLAASINLDAIAAAAKNDCNRVTIYSEGYPTPFVVDLRDLKIHPEESGATSALIRGIAARLVQLGYDVGGFDANITSDVLPGSGLSSSAAIEVLIGTIFNVLVNENKIAAPVLAEIGQYAENEYFGKPCGLMDQMACAVGGILTIDFKTPGRPAFQQIDFDFNKQGYALLVVDTGGNHADLTADYAAIPKEMKAVARALGGEVCRDIRLQELQAKIRELRGQTGDRAILRALHFLQENERVKAQAQAMEKGNFDEFLKLVAASGNSSFKWLQNVYTAQNVHEQGVTLALALADAYLTSVQAGACRVHGGGFAGTIQVFVPQAHKAGLVKILEDAFGAKSVLELMIRPLGTRYLGRV